MAPEIKTTHRHRISTTTAFMMLAVAFFGFDLADAVFDVLIIGIVINFIFTTPLAWFTYWVWFKTHDVGMFDKFWRAIIMFSIGLLKGAPFIGSLFLWLPGWTFSTFIIIWLVWREDKAFNADLDKKALEAAKKLQRRRARETEALAANEQMQAQNIAAQNQQLQQQEEIEMQTAAAYNRYNEDLYGGNDNGLNPQQQAV